jgi:hypothetical protein
LRAQLTHVHGAAATCGELRLCGDEWPEEGSAQQRSDRLLVGGWKQEDNERKQQHPAAQRRFASSRSLAAVEI